MIFAQPCFLAQAKPVKCVQANRDAVIGTDPTPPVSCAKIQGARRVDDEQGRQEKQGRTRSPAISRDRGLPVHADHRAFIAI